MKSKRHTRLAIVVSAVLLVVVGGTAIALGAGRAEVLSLPKDDDRPVVTLYGYDFAQDNGDSDEVKRHFTGKLLPDANTGVTALTDTIFIDVHPPEGAVSERVYCAVEGQEAILVSSGRWLNPHTHDFEASRQPRGGTFDPVHINPDGFTGSIWAVTTDADGVAHTSDVIPVIWVKPLAEWQETTPPEYNIPLYIARLTHDGSVQTIELDTSRLEVERNYTLRVTDGRGKPLWETDANLSHAGWNAVFLTHIDGKDYLIMYNPTMYQGSCSYSFRIFSLDSNGNEILLDKDEVAFGINPPGGNGSFRKSDIEPVKAFFEHVNQYLPDSYLLINTDRNVSDIIPGGVSYSTQTTPVTGLREYFFESAALTMNEQMDLFVQDYVDRYGEMED